LGQIYGCLYAVSPGTHYYHILAQFLFLAVDAVDIIYIFTLCALDLGNAGSAPIATQD